MTVSPAFFQRNPHMRDELPDYEEVRRIERIEQDAAEYFAEATKPQKRVFDDTMLDAQIWYGTNNWHYARAKALSHFRANTVEASALFDRTIVELTNDGEISEELDAAWTALSQPAAPRVIQVGDHTPELSAA